MNKSREETNWINRGEGHWLAPTYGVQKIGIGDRIYAMATKHVGPMSKLGINCDGRVVKMGLLYAHQFGGHALCALAFML